MSGFAAVRFVAAGSVGAQRWAAPVLFWAVGVGVTFVSGGGPLATLAQAAAWLFPTGAWLVVATTNTEDAGQAAVTATALGGPVRARLVKLAVAGTAAVLLAALSVGLAAAFAGGRITAAQCLFGATAVFACTIGGCALGLLCAHPVVDRPGWAVLVVLLTSLLELVVPHVPPVRAVVTILDSDRGSNRWNELAAVIGETVAASAALMAAALALGRRRS